MRIIFKLVHGSWEEEGILKHVVVQLQHRIHLLTSNLHRIKFQSDSLRKIKMARNMDTLL